MRPGPGRGVRHPARRGRLPRLDLHDVPAAARRGGGARAAQAGDPPGHGQARAGRRRTQPRVVLGHHQAARPGQVDLLLPVRDPRHLQPLRGGLDARPHTSAPPWPSGSSTRLDRQAAASGRGQLTIHADRGSSMASKPVAQLLADLGVTKSHSRPHVSNDNPYSEAQFKTLKYRPDFPDRFGSIQDARDFCQQLLRLVQPRAPPLRDRLAHPRQTSTTAAPSKSRRPGRGPHRRLRRPPRAVRPQTPQPPRLPTTAWINKPDTEEAAQ